MKTSTKTLLNAFCLLSVGHAELSVPAFTGYIEPDFRGLEVSAEHGVTRWQDSSQHVLWFGEFKRTGQFSDQRRKSLYDRQWIATADGKRTELTTATFSHDPTGKANRLDRFMGVENGRFFLSQGGFIEGFAQFGTPFQRPAMNEPPSFKLP